MILGASAEAEAAEDKRVEAVQAEIAARSELVDEEGTALTDLRPVGTVRVGDQKVEALAETGVISAGSRVRVVSVSDNQGRVRALG